LGLDNVAQLVEQTLSLTVALRVWMLPWPLDAAGVYKNTSLSQREGI